MARYIEWQDRRAHAMSPSIIQRSVRSGLLAGALAAVVAGWRAAAEGSSAIAPINAVTHCLWPHRAFAETHFSARFSLTGLAIHEASAVLWAMLFEGLRDRLSRGSSRRDAVAVATAATATAATAYAVDYHLVPERLTPGFDAHLSNRSLAAVYIALAAGLAAAALLGGARSDD
ncbi:hypothetical protein [Paraburkholderia diazotrophica]|uniref:hypothetical protein n=1 Tax=Paraburkholderia diazotrophica TaxID=667676 RepID=UPI003181D124